MSGNGRRRRRHRQRHRTDKVEGSNQIQIAIRAYCETLVDSNAHFIFVRLLFVFMRTPAECDFISIFLLSLRAEYEFDINSMRWCRWKRNRTTGLSSVIRNEKQNVIIYFVDRFQALAHAISFAERKFTSKDSIFALLNKNRKFRIAEIPNDI